MQLIQIFIDNIVPILVIAGIGFWLRRRFLIQPKPIGAILFNVLSPALVFNSLYTSEMDGGAFLRLYGVSLLFLMTMAALAYLILRLQNASLTERMSVTLTSFSMNAGNFGLSLVSFAFGEEALSRAVVVFVANTSLSYSLGVYLASYGGQSRKLKSPVRRSLLSILRTPAMYAVLAAFMFKGVGIELPLSNDRTVTLLASGAIPMMILLLGLQLGQFTDVLRPTLLATGSVVRLLLSPLIAVGFALLFGLPQLDMIAFVLQAGMPTAVLTIILATEFDLDRDLILNLIMTSTLLSPFTLSVIILFLQHL